MTSGLQWPKNHWRFARIIASSLVEYFPDSTFISTTICMWGIKIFWQGFPKSILTKTLCKWSPQYSQAESSWVKLSWAESRWVELSRTESNWVEMLSWVQLSWPELSWVKLSRAESSWVELSQAESSWAELSQAESSWVKLSQGWVKLSQAELGYWRFNLSLFYSILLLKSLRGFWLFIKFLNMLEQPKAGLISQFYRQGWKSA